MLLCGTVALTCVLGYIWAVRSFIILWLLGLLTLHTHNPSVALLIQHKLLTQSKT